jgi:hypothetical protein
MFFASTGVSRPTPSSRSSPSGRAHHPALEATLHWAWLHDELVTRGYRVEAAHAAQVKLITRARCKTDPIDAR